MAEELEPYRTESGRVLTDADIEAMADEAERGYEVAMLKAGRRSRPVIGSAPDDLFPVRLDPDLRHALSARAEAEHTTTNEIIRKALRQFLDVA